MILLIMFFYIVRLNTAVVCIIQYAKSLNDSMFVKISTSASLTTTVCTNVRTRLEITSVPVLQACRDRKTIAQVCSSLH